LVGKSEPLINADEPDDTDNTSAESSLSALISGSDHKFIASL